MSDPRYEERETERAASETARIGGGSGGEAEGFEEVEELLVEHASHERSSETDVDDGSP